MGVINQSCLDLIDAHAHQLVWRAYASGEMDRVPDQGAVDRVARAVFQHYPPSPPKH